MRILEELTGPIAAQVSQRGLGVVIGAGFASFLVLAVVCNVLAQLLLKNPNEPPVVFHWFPVVGNTVMYGMDPYRFFFECRAKVCFTREGGSASLTGGSMVISSRSSY
jgi:sterol 14alpha-demethylase